MGKKNRRRHMDMEAEGAVDAPAGRLVPAGDGQGGVPPTGAAAKATAPVPASDLLARLDSLAVFRALLDDPVVSALRSLLELGAEAGRAQGPGRPVPDEAARLAGAYAAFVSELFASGASSLAAYVRDAAEVDANVYVRTVGSGQTPSAAMEACVTSELATLQRVADLTPSRLLSCVGLSGAADGAQPAGDVLAGGFLPVFDAEVGVDLAADFRARVADIGRYGYGMFARYRAFTLDAAGSIVAVRHPDPTRLADLADYEAQKRVIVDNTRALLAGRPAANILLTGDAGTGKSSTVKAVVNELADEGLRILEVSKDQLHLIPAVLDELSANPLKFILFIDDLSFTVNDDNYAALKAILEGSVAAKSSNVAIYATSNRRHLVRESFADREGDEVHLNDTLQETMSLSDRFGIHLTFEKPDKRTYLDIVRQLATAAGIDYDPADLDALAERYALRRGGRSARGARQLVDALLSGSQHVAPARRDG
ncbi:MAG: ATP-binding protein [Coriobacteriales bacterium]|jgi:predicted AAA+ superfamily ATPase